jgi:hypothetical protein
MLYAVPIPFPHPPALPGVPLVSVDHHCPQMGFISKGPILGLSADIPNRGHICMGKKLGSTCQVISPPEIVWYVAGWRVSHHDQECIDPAPGKRMKQLASDVG